MDKSLSEIEDQLMLEEEDQIIKKETTILENGNHELPIIKQSYDVSCQCDPWVPTVEVP